MFCLNDTMRYHLCPGRTDMRKGINSLIGVVTFSGAYPFTIPGLQSVTLGVRNCTF